MREKREGLLSQTPFPFPFKRLPRRLVLFGNLLSKTLRSIESDAFSKGGVQSSKYGIQNFVKLNTIYGRL